MRVIDGKHMIKIRIFENNVDSNGRISCSICGASNYQTMIRHLKSKHNLTPKEYQAMFPEDKVFTDEMSSKFSKGGFAANQSMKDKGFDFSERSRKARETELRNDPDSYFKRNQKLYSNPDFKERATSRIMNASPWHRDRYYYKDLSLRSSWEVKFAEWLDSEGINYEYEKVKINYISPNTNSSRTYYPDFYLPDYNLCIEIKPKMYLANPEVIAKAEATKDAGYGYRFITQDELNDLSIKLLNV